MLQKRCFNCNFNGKIMNELKVHEEKRKSNKYLSTAVSQISYSDENMLCVVKVSNLITGQTQNTKHVVFLDSHSVTLTGRHIHKCGISLFIPLIFEKM